MATHHLLSHLLFYNVTLPITHQEVVVSVSPPLESRLAYDSLIVNEIWRK